MIRHANHIFTLDPARQHRLSTIQARPVARAAKRLPNAREGLMTVEDVPSWISPLVIVGSFLLVVIAETLRPLRAMRESKLRRTIRNLTTGGISLAVMTLLQTPLLLPVAGWVEREQIGLLNVINLTPGLALVLSVILLDYTLWFWHWLNHKVPFFWRFHLVHHVDLDMDASTALRFHFGELALSILFRAAQIIVLGIDSYAVWLWQTILFASILFHHSSLRLPRRLEQYLVHLLVTPRMHEIHHSTRFDETSSNWSSLLSVWDKLHRTFRMDVPHETVVIGVPAYQEPEDVTIGKILTLPFRRQRDDWKEQRGLNEDPAEA